ncbi:MAG: hypothetical protein Q8R15_00335 [Candidatus Micrarchaeota archaeon]|nr:hypothetical protein [Candidatus Micrarchaeota archaeon]
MIEPYYIGLAGLVLLLFAWIPETLKTIREKKSPIELKFSIVYAVGSAALMTYAYLLGDLIFAILNLLTTLLALMNAYYAVKKTKHTTITRLTKTKKKTKKRK